MKKVISRGFTLIELLVVIAIIGILASIVLVSLNSARSKGKDTRILSDVNEVRTQIEAEAASSGAYTAGASYCVTATNTLNSASNNCATLKADAVANGGTLQVVATVVGTSFSSYSVWGGLTTAGAGFYCVDSSGNAKNEATSTVPVTPCP